jgi:hypothetical protein
MAPTLTGHAAHASQTSWCAALRHLRARATPELRTTR